MQGFILDFKKAHKSVKIAGKEQETSKAVEEKVRNNKNVINLIESWIKIVP